MLVILFETSYPGQMLSTIINLCRSKHYFISSLLSDRNLKTSNSILYSKFSGNRFVHLTQVDMTKALVLGAYQSNSAGSSVSQLTEAGAKIDAQVSGKLQSLIKDFGPSKKGKAKTFYNIHPDYPVISVVGLGSPNAGFNEAEDVDEKRENIRSSIASAAKSVRDEQGVDEVHFDPCEDAEACAEGAHLALWYYDKLKSEKYKRKVVKIDVFNASGDAKIKEAFERGTKLAEAQNVCRLLSETPANYMTPTIFGETVVDLFKNLPKVKVTVHEKQWAENKKMRSFLSVAKGSAEPPKFVEIHFNNKPDSKPFVLVGKGITFDSGGISIKPAANMEKMRYDMGGAANVVTTTYALASLDAKVNIIALAPLCENLPSGTANKPGDVVIAMNGKSIQIDNTDAEGRLILADALCYAHEFDPQAILDIATLTGAMSIALGSGATGVFTNSTKLFDILKQAATHTGDRVWRMPLYSHYKTQVIDSQLADCLNIGKNGGQGGSCTAAAFLSEFVTCKQWLHLDIAGVMESKDEYAYYCKGMSGRPVRTLHRFLEEFFSNN